MICLHNSHNMVKCTKLFGLINSLTLISQYSGDNLFERFWQSGTEPNPKAPLLFAYHKLGFICEKNSKFANRAITPWSIQNIFVLINNMTLMSYCSVENVFRCFLTKCYRPNSEVPILCCSSQIGFFSVRKFYNLPAQQLHRDKLSMH